ncbi:hypothetical protein LAT59_04850 [Candidatus Gracilibacteria bacterium]|nr:hypothetical protein [Candidatus Gracilibacteria bacterium]
MCPTKKLLTGALVATLCLAYALVYVPKANANESMYFTVTAYYSPLPGQSRYITGSYEGDKRLNGSGIITASGKEVFQGLIAAPSNYPFGTKIYLKGYGIGEVADRGGAIVNAGQRGHAHDRLDIWLGHGDAGLDRAIRWGRRSVTGKIVVPSSEITLSFPETTGIAYESLRVGPDGEQGQVRQLQQVLADIGIYNGEVDGIYESVKDVFIDFQLQYEIIPDRGAPGAGYFGPRTVDVIRDMLPRDTRILIEEPQENFYNYNHHKASELYRIVLEYGNLQVTPESSEADIQLLQELLTELGEYNGIIDGSYESIREVLIDFQIKIGLIQNRDDWGAGYFGNRTKTALWNYYEGQEAPEKHIRNNTVTLSTHNQNQIRGVFPQLVSILENRARRNGEHTSIQLQHFKDQMIQMIPQIQDQLVLVRIDFLIKLIDTEIVQL